MPFRMEHAVPKKPIVRFYLLFGLMFAVLTGRLFHLQVIRGPYYQRLSSRNHIRVIATPAPRGVIYDRNGTIVADSRPVFVVSVIPADFDSSNTGALAELSGLDPESVSEVLREGASRPFIPVMLRSGLLIEEVSSLAENLHLLGGVTLEVMPRRRYPMGELYCHIVGYVGMAEEDYRYPGETTGRSGIEMSHNDLLRGEPGFRSQVVDALGQVVEEFEGAGESFPVPGDDLWLTTDSRLMSIADSLLSDLGIPGAIVALDYESGEVLCLSSWPTFDPDAFVSGMSIAEWDALRTDARNPMLSRAWSALYPPGSTYKIISAAYLLENGLIDRSSRPEPCFGVYELGGDRFGCWRSHGRIGLIDALSQSCDIYFYRVIQEGSMDELADFTRQFGLGSTLLGLPGELEGLVPDRQLMLDMYGEGGWGTGNLLNISIGQGELLVTPLQMGLVAGAFASRGSMPALSIISGEQPSMTDISLPELSQGTWDLIHEGMRDAVQNRRGTLNRAMGASPLSFYGKSGTAESPTGDHAWFIGFIQEPLPLAVAVVIESGGHGGTVAAPVAEALLRIYCSGEESGE